MLKVENSYSGKNEKYDILKAVETIHRTSFGDMTYDEFLWHLRDSATDNSIKKAIVHELWEIGLASFQVLILCSKSRNLRDVFDLRDKIIANKKLIIWQKLKSISEFIDKKYPRLKDSEVRDIVNRLKEIYDCDSSLEEFFGSDDLGHWTFTVNMLKRGIIEQILYMRSDIVTKELWLINSKFFGFEDDWDGNFTNVVSPEMKDEMRSYFSDYLLFIISCLDGPLSGQEVESLIWDKLRSFLSGDDFSLEEDV